MTLLIAATAGSIGALARYILSGTLQRRTGSHIPVGTAAVNLIGALALGAVVGAASIPSLLELAVVGFLGGFTTFSTWMVETVRLGILPRPSLGSMLNLTVLPTLGVMLAALGYYLAS